MLTMVDDERMMGTVETNHTKENIMRYTIQSKLAYSFIGKMIAKQLAKLPQNQGKRVHWIQQEMAEFGIK